MLFLSKRITDSDFFRNFCYAEPTWHSEMKRKCFFLFAFLSFFRNFGRICRISLYKGSSKD